MDSNQIEVGLDDEEEETNDGKQLTKPETRQCLLPFHSILFTTGLSRSFVHTNRMKEIKKWICLYFCALEAGRQASE